MTKNEALDAATPTRFSGYQWAVAFNEFTNERFIAFRTPYGEGRTRGFRIEVGTGKTVAEWEQEFDPAGCEWRPIND